MSDAVSAPTAPENSTGQNAPTENNQQQQAPQPPSKRQYKYKADEQEVVEELSDEEIASRLALSKTAGRKMQEAAAQRKQAEEFFKRLKENPMEILLDDRVAGQQKFREMAEKFLIEQLQLEQMTPEERARLDRDKELERYKQAEKQRQEEEQQRQAQQQEQMWAERYEKTIIETLEKTGLPKNPRTVARMANLLQTALKHGIDADATLLAEMANNDYRDELKAVVKDSSAEQLLALFGDELANKIRKHDLSRLQPRNPAPKPTPNQQSSAPVAKNLSPREFSEQLRARFQK